MYLKSLEMHGFKSFPDKTVLTFGKGMTGVVGPNGSGKSNISDAVRWVLGEQSTKNLRGAKMEDVIFSGTETRHASGFAEVTLRLDNTDGSLANPENEVAVTRRYYRSGDGQYQINGKNVRLRDVHELFMDTGLGRDGYSMVSQGKIEDMVSAKSTDRRDMFEEAAGISHYRYRRTDALHRLEQAEENLVRLRDILSELESRVGPLEEQSKKAQKFLVLAGEKKDLEIGLWCNVLDRSQEQLREQANRIEVARHQYEQVCAQLEKAAQSIDFSAEEGRRLTQRMEELQDKAATYDEQAGALDAQAAVYEATVRHNEENIARLRTECEEENKTERELTGTLEKNRSAITELEEREEQENRVGEGIGAEIGELRGRDEEVSGEYNEISRALAGLAPEISRLEIMAGSACASIEEIVSRMQTVENAISEHIEEEKKLTDEIASADEKIKAAKAEVLSAENAVSGYGMRLKNIQEKAEKAKEDFENLKLIRTTKQARLSFLEDTEKSMEGYQGSVKAVMREVRKGALTGIRGTLSQLITVEERYSVAIETALGNAIQDIVTENENDAKKAIAMLKQSNAGRATFLPLTAVRGRTLDEKNIEACRGFVSLAPELVVCADEYREIISSLLGKTVVAEDLDCAISIAKQYAYRFKIVTLDGQVINPGGSMTGGSKIQNAGFISRANETERLKRELKQSEKTIADAQRICNAQLQAVETEKAQLAAAQEEQLRRSEVLLHLQGDRRLAEGRLRECGQALSDLRGETKKADERTRYFNENIRIAKEKSGILYSKKKELEDRLAELSGGRDSLVRQREALMQELTAVNLRILEIRKDIAARKENNTGLQQRLASHAEKIASLEKEIRDAERKAQSFRNDAVSTREAAKALREEATAARDETKKLSENRLQTENLADSARSEERRLTSEREKCGAELARSEERHASMQHEQEEVERKLFEEYGLTHREAQRLDIDMESVPKAQRRLADLKNAIKALGNVNVAAIEEYKEVSERYRFMSEQMTDAEKSKTELLRLIGDLTESMGNRFRERFTLIRESFRETFAQIFNGGTAELLLEDESNILECGIEIKVQPPGKNVRSLSLLSGGEKGLCAIALLFAILKVTPAPFCIFDEVEAALDDVNVARFARFVRGLTDKTQFILITHRRGTMEESDVLYGVTMQEEGVSKLLELHTAEMAKKLGIEE